MRDGTYVMQRNKLIPLAELAADLHVGTRPEGKPTSKKVAKWISEWNTFFLQYMDLLAYTHGVTTSTGLSFANK